MTTEGGSIPSRKSWLEGPYARAVARSPERQDHFETSGGIPVEPLYTPEDGPAVGYNESLGFPGEFPFTRGIQPTMYRGRLWTMRQYAGFGTAEESNARYRYLLDRGQTGLSVAFDLPTQIGYDSDDPMALGEVGKVGVAIDSVEDMLLLFDQIPLERVTTSMTINATAGVLLGMYLSVAEEQGVPFSQLRGTVQNDILKEYITRGTYIFPPKPSLRLVTDLFAYCREAVPGWNTISISGYHMREAGSTAAQEVGFTLANAVQYVNAALEAGHELDEFAGQLSFFFACHGNFLEEVAKFRAARRLWARIMKDQFGAKNPRSMMLRFHTQTGGATLTAQQPENNIVRTTVQALAAILGGTQSLHTNSMDEALGLPTEKAVQIALRTQQVLAHECGVADVIDPLGGSYCVEALTDRIESDALREMAAIEEMGGALAALERGYQQRMIQEAAYRFQRDIEEDRRKIVGVNVHAEEEVPVESFEMDPTIEERQVERVRELRVRRDNARVDQLTVALSKAAEGSENLIPLIGECVANRVTVGEINHALRRVWGEYSAPVVI